MMLLWPLVATIVIELLVLRFLGESQRRVLWASVGMNILTNVPLNLAALYGRYMERAGYRRTARGRGRGVLLLAAAE